VIPVSEKFGDYARSVTARLQADGLRVRLDDRNEKVGYKVREAQVQKIPFMLVVGGREQEQGTVSVRNRYEGDLGAMELDQFTRLVKSHIDSRAIRP